MTKSAHRGVLLLANGETSGTRTLTAPTRPGQFEFRYLADGGFLDLARRRPVTVR